MAIFRGGVKMGTHDFPLSISKQRGQGILRKLDIIQDGKGRKAHEKDAMGEVQTIRSVVGMGEGFTMPVNFKVEFAMPKGIDQQVLQSQGPPPSSPPSPSGANGSKVKFGGLDWQTHIMNKSTKEEFKKLYDAAQAAARGTYKLSLDDDGRTRELQKLNLYCSKVSIPEKSITTTLIRQYGAPFPYPQGVQYGTISTTFYCDGTMHIKSYFDAWQKMIYNDLTGNFNYYNEYVADFDVYTRTTMGNGGALSTEKKTSVMGDISKDLQKATADLNDLTGVDNPRSGTQTNGKPIPTVNFRENYGVKVFDCFPARVGEIALAHDATDQIATFDVEWSYLKWNPFKIGNVGNRSRINLSVGEFRNEKDGFPFLEDLPPELSGPLTSRLDQAMVTSPLSKGANLFG
jgi:hypothetical protein